MGINVAILHREIHVIEGKRNNISSRMLCTIMPLQISSVERMAVLVYNALTSYRGEFYGKL